MRELIAVILALLSTLASAEEWIVVRKPTDPGQAGTQTIYLDTTSIEIHNGVRHARSKIIYLADGHEFEASRPPLITVMIWSRAYDCGKRMTRDESIEIHNTDGSVRVNDLSDHSGWYPFPANKYADATIDFVCEWKLT
jgi:hypothetical protein